MSNNHHSRLSEEEDNEDVDRSSGGWLEHRMWVVRTLRDIAEQQDDNTKEIIAIKIKIAGMAMAAGGTTGGIIVALIELIKFLVTHK